MAKDRSVTVVPESGGKISIRLDPALSEAENDRFNHRESVDREAWRLHRRDIKVLSLRLR